MRSLTRPRSGGFTLIELMVAVAIVTILTGIALGSYRQQAMRAKRTEAVVGLGAIHRSQESYRAAELHYGDTFDEIGFVLDGGTRIGERTIRAATYTFEVEALPLDGDPRGNFQARATGDLDPGDGVLDVLLIENVLTVLP